jgi:hypothetical protein
VRGKVDERIYQLAAGAVPTFKTMSLTSYAKLATPSTGVWINDPSPQKILFQKLHQPD